MQVDEKNQPKTQCLSDDIAPADPLNFFDADKEVKGVEDFGNKKRQDGEPKYQIFIFGCNCYNCCSCSNCCKYNNP